MTSLEIVDTPNFRSNHHFDDPAIEELINFNEIPMDNVFGNQSISEEIISEESCSRGECLIENEERNY